MDNLQLNPPPGEPDLVRELEQRVVDLSSRFIAFHALASSESAPGASDLAAAVNTALSEASAQAFALGRMARHYIGGRPVADSRFQLADVPSREVFDFLAQALNLISRPVDPHGTYKLAHLAHMIVSRMYAVGYALNKQGRTQTPQTFQEQVNAWMTECFVSDIIKSKEERNHRFLEEALELVQANGIDRDTVHALVNYVFERPPGALNREVGGVMVSLAALCTEYGLSLDWNSQEGLRRCWDRIDVIREKQKGKRDALARCRVDLYGDTQDVIDAIIGEERSELSPYLEEAFEDEEQFFVLENVLGEIRAKGWYVAAHNDYAIGGERGTFWRFTNPERRMSVRGEGSADDIALAQVRKQIREIEDYPAFPAPEFSVSPVKDPQILPPSCPHCFLSESHNVEFTALVADAEWMNFHCPKCGSEFVNKPTIGLVAVFQPKPKPLGCDHHMDCDCTGEG